MPRLTRQTIKRYRDSVRRVWKSAQALGAKGLADVPGYAAVEAHLAASEPDDPLYMHVSKPKTREPWSEERLVRLFESPIYRGCASADRRWLPGRLVIRDALYWVPLLLATIGTRITELLEITPRDIMQKNGVLCLAIGRTAEKHIKTTGSIRYVPIPQLLLDLGFAEWVAEKDSAGATMLFTEIARRTGTRSLADTFLKVRQQVWKHLDLTDHDEDCYALRKTLQTMLEANGVSEGRRQALAGHLNGKIVNRHYTAFHLRALKAEVDRAGHRIVVRDCPERGFPVIDRCAIADELPETTLDITLGTTGIASVTLARGDGKASVALNDVSPREAAYALPEQVAEILATEQIRRPSRGPRAEMADRLCAFAAVRVGAVHAVSRTKAIEAAVIGCPLDSRQLAEL